LVIGNVDFRAFMAFRLTDGSDGREVLEIDPDGSAFEPVHAPKADVTLIQADGAGGNGNIEIGRAIQRWRSGTAVALVLERMERWHLADYWWELNNWSLASPVTCDDPEKLANVVESAASGIRWTDTQFLRVLRKCEEAGGPHAFAVSGVGDLPDFLTPHGEWTGGRLEKADATPEPDGTWLDTPRKRRR